MCAIAYNQLFADTICKTIDVVLNANNKSIDHQITIAPNPAQQQVLISSKNNRQQLSTIELYNLQGKQMHIEYVIKENVAKFDVAHLAKGFYYVQITTIGGEKALKKLAVQ